MQVWILGVVLTLGLAEASALILSGAATLAPPPAGQGAGTVQTNDGSTGTPPPTAH
jgi:hypothetical protein